MKAIVKGTVISGVGISILGISLALSSAGVVSGANNVAPAAAPTPLSCKQKKTNACLTVQNKGSGIAIEGLAGSGFGVYALSKSTAGVYGESQSVNSAGVYGDATSSSDGVYGNSNSGAGVAGLSGSGSAVEGTSSTGYGLFADSASNDGIMADSSDDTGNFAAIAAQGESINTLIFSGFNEVNDAGCIIDNHADLSCTGTVMGGAVQVRHPTSSGQHVLAYGSESTSATIEDFGTARMFDGVANVYFERDFASTIDRNSPYYVFLTPLSDQRGLYLSIKGSNGFQVRENEHGRDTLEFDYRIVARPLGAKHDRLTVAPAMRMPPKTIH